MNYDVIVIGGGIGGLAFSAVASARLGKKVLLLEKNSFIGGRLSSFQRDGFTLDIGAHVISQSEKGPLGSILRTLGKDKDITWEHVRPMTSYKGEIFAFPKGLAGRISDEQYAAVLSTIKEIREMSDADTQKLDTVDLRTYLNQKGISDPLALECFNNIVKIYVCVPYHKASAGEFIRCFCHEAESRASGYPVGGCGVIANALVDGITENGAVIRTNSEVKEIIVENGKAVGVRTQDAEYRAPIIVSNADGRRTLLDLLPAGSISAEEYSRVQKMTYSYSMLIVRMALKHSVTDQRLITHIVEGLDSKRYEEDLLAGRFPEEMPLFMPVPSNFSSECVPEGHQLITAGAIIPYETPDIERLEEIVVNTAMKILPGLKDALMWRHVTSPAGLHAAVVEDGAIIGLGQTVDQVGKSRLSVVTAVPGLYLCGAESGGSGVGIELAINSAFELLDILGEKEAAWKAANNA
ncbi:phytoene desaturase family protein [Sporomusa sphaeroides]|uniref:phytoene desaturase family protein n=1 Tax=Sporomusa sphaeroides TaxID=47679 RepID=UPI002C68D3D5|nr:NAD(P)/FAD-dependent oxidoreductase [Sporomusa sphaeroides]HML31837.1 NAD(P)/FAD-dependent oxidoreductase [Sporomusa sphaeroides]